jgi:ABC-2 type transport system permease protein
MSVNIKAIQPRISLAQPGLAAGLRALSAVARRSWLVFVRYPSWVFAFFIWPIIFPLGYVLTGRALAGPDGSGLKIFAQAAGTSDFMGFIAIGTMVWMWQNVVLWNVGTDLREEQLRGTLETNWLTPTWRFSFLLGSSATHMLTMLFFILVAGLEYVLIFGVHFVGSGWLALLVMLASIPSIYGLGFAFASLVITAKEANAFVFLVRGVVMIFCGITFPLSVMPGWMQDVARWLPASYTIHAMRSVLLNGAGLDVILPDLRALLISGAILLAGGYLLFNWMERRSRQTGAISQY